MIITGVNLDLFYRNIKKACFEKYKEIEKEQIGYDLCVGQAVHSISYVGMAGNKFLKYFCNILDIDDKGVLFTDQHNKETFYQWEFYYKNHLNKIDKMNLVIRPCDYLFEKHPIKSLIKDEKNSDIWYKHGGWTTSSNYEKNLYRFKILGQQELI